MAAAGLWITASDLARFALAVQNSLAGRPGAILSHFLAAQMVATKLGKRGVMFGVAGSEENPYFAHSGQDEGFVSYLVAYEKKGDGAIVLTNGNRGFDLAQEITRAIAQEYEWPDFHPVEHPLATLASQQLEKYAGTYRIAPVSSCTSLATTTIFQF
jgi:CubicO group peptidase (beta-lactamase class C family)